MRMGLLRTQRSCHFCAIAGRSACARRRWWDGVLRLKRGRIECNTTLSRERFLRPDGSEVSAVNSPVDGSNIPEEVPSSPEDDPEGGAVLAGGAALS